MPSTRCASGLRGQLMLALYRSGPPGRGAAGLPGRAPRARRELGIEPGRALQQLHAAILRQDARSTQPGARAGVAETAAARSSTRSRRAARACARRRDRRARAQARGAVRLPAGRGGELPRAAQYVALMQGVGPLYDELHELLAARRAADAGASLLRRAAAAAAERGAPHQLIVTTSYDLRLEQAFLDAGEEFDVVSYLASRARSAASSATCRRTATPA